MAIDSSVKRSSVLQLKLPFRMTLPFPTGTIVASERASIAGAYAGSSFLPPSSQRIINGLVMVEIGLTILTGLSTNLYKGLIEDDLGNIPNR